MKICLKEKNFVCGSVGKVINRIAVPVFKKYGFKYSKGFKNQLWLFERPIGICSQEIAIHETFSRNELDVSFRSMRYPLIVLNPIKSLDKNILTPWSFSDSKELENAVLDLVHKVEQFLIPYFDNEIYSLRTIPL